nr:hypothetical protein [Tanacetum cinerariifolium]
MRISCTIKGKPLVLSWRRIPRLDSGVRVSRILGFLRISLISVSEPKWDPEKAGSACDRDLRTLVSFHGCLLVRGSAFTRLARPKAHCNNMVQAQRPGMLIIRHQVPQSSVSIARSTVACGISRYYTLDEDAYPEFLGDNDEGMDFLAFIRTADPTKVRVAERQRAKNEPRVLESTVGRVLPLFSVVPARASSELEAMLTDFLMRGLRKRKTAVADAGGPSHPPKKSREDFRALGGASIADKSMAVVQSLFFGAMLEAEARGEPVPTLPFVTSSVSATPEREDRSPADSVPGPNLRTIGAPQRSSAPAIATVTTITAAIDTEATATRAPVAPSLFGVGSSSTSRSNSVPGGFSDVSGSDFLIGGIRTVVNPDSDLQKVYASRWSVTNRFGLDNSRICHEMKKRKLRDVVDEQAELLKTKDREIESLKAQLLLKEANTTEAIRLRAEVFKFKSAEQSLRGEVRFLRDQNTALEREKIELNVKVTDLSASVKVREQEVADLDAQVTAVKLQNDNLVGQVCTSILDFLFS